MMEIKKYIKKDKQGEDMFNVAVINSLEVKDASYLENLQGEQLTIYSFERLDSQDQVASMDAIIIAETPGEQQMSKTCETIINIRKFSTKRIWILAEQSTKAKRIIYLHLGCDYVFNQQIDSDELSLYVTLTLEREARASSFDPQKTDLISPTDRNLNELTLIPNNISVDIEGKREVRLTKLEFEFLKLLMKNKGEMMSYKKLYFHIWGEENSKDKYRLANLVCLLRKKIEKDYKNPVYIKTIRSKGYMFAQKK